MTAVLSVMIVFDDEEEDYYFSFFFYQEKRKRKEENHRLVFLKDVIVFLLSLLSQTSIFPHRSKVATVTYATGFAQ